MTREVHLPLAPSKAAAPWAAAGGLPDAPPAAGRYRIGLPMRDNVSAVGVAPAYDAQDGWPAMQAVFLFKGG